MSPGNARAAVARNRRFHLAWTMLALVAFALAIRSPGHANANAVATLKGDAHTLNTELLNGTIGARVNGITLPPNPSSAGLDLNASVVNLAGLGLLTIQAGSGTVATNCSGDGAGPTVSAHCDSGLDNLSISLAGIPLVTAAAVNAHSTTSSTGGTPTTSSTGSGITDLCVAGTACVGAPLLNTSIDGSVLLLVDLHVDVLTSTVVNDDGIPGRGLRVTALRIELNLPILGTNVATIELVQAYSYLGNVVQDDTGPDTVIDTTPANPSTVNSFLFTFHGTDVGGTGVDHFECSLNNTPDVWTTCTSGSSFGPFNEGSNTFKVRAVDAAENVDPTPATYTWVKDTGAPDTTIVNKPSDPSTETTYPFTYTGSDGAGSGVDHFECRLNSSSPAAWTTCTSGSSIGTFQLGSNTFEVRAVDGAGNVDPTPATYTWTVNPGPLPAPTYTGASGTKTTATVTWADNALDEDGYDVFRCGPDGCFLFKISLAANSTTWTDTNVTPGTYYAYWVRATRGATVAWAKSFVTIVTTSERPERPFPSTAAGVSQSSIRLTWIDRSVGEDGFKILRYTDGTWVEKGSVGPNTTTWLDTTGELEAGTPYAYWIVAYHGANWSYADYLISANTWPSGFNPTPGGLAAPTYAVSSATATSVTLNWNDNASNETGYEVLRCGPDACFASKALLPAGTTTWQDTDIVPGTYYAYWVYAKNGAASAPAATFMTAVSTSLNPAWPQPSTARGISQTGITLTWLDNSSDEDGFQILRYVNGDWVVKGTVGPNVTTWTDTTGELVAGGEYAYWVVSVRGGTISYAGFYIAANTWP